MKRHLATALTLLLAASTASAQNEPANAEPLPAIGEVRVTDEAAEGTTVRRGVSRFIVRAPMTAVVREFTDFGHYTEIMPRIAESRVVRRTRAGTEVYMQVRLGANLGVLWSRLRLSVHRAQGVVEITGTSLEGNVDRFELSTRIEPVPDAPSNTLITCRMLTVPQLPFPSTVFTRENREALATMANRFRTRIEAPPTAAPPAAPAPPANAAPPAAPTPATAQPS